MLTARGRLCCVRAYRSLKDHRAELVSGLEAMVDAAVAAPCAPAFSSPMLVQKAVAPRADALPRAQRERRAPPELAPAPEEAAPPKPKGRSGARKPKGEDEPPGKRGRPSGEDKLAKAEAKTEAAEKRARDWQQRAEAAEEKLKAQEVDLAVAKAKLQASFFITQAAGLARMPGQPGSSSDGTPDTRASGALPTPAALEKFFMM